MAHDMGPSDPEILREEPRMRSVPCEADRARPPGTAGRPDTVVVQEAVPVREGWLVEKWCKPVGEDTGMNEHHRFASPEELVLQLDIVEYRAFHFDPP